jgi:demethylmenaquinone methyltransferase/2-methoxy-6-polyprenyl-1,4-benzoquinol methylase
MDARTLFAPLGPDYDRWANLLSFGQDPRWRRFLVSRLHVQPLDTVLDVATGTAAVALELARQKDCYVVGVDQSAEMLAVAKQQVRLAGATEKIRLEQGDARSLPFDDGTFDGLTFTYLLRYVEDPAATLRELARVVKPGGVMAGLEFGVPRGVWRPLWELWVRAGLPGAGRVIGHGWYEVGTFLGPSIRNHYAEWPVPRLLQAWRAAGIEDVRAKRLSVGGGIVTWGRKKT